MAWFPLANIYDGYLNAFFYPEDQKIGEINITCVTKQDTQHKKDDKAVDLVFTGSITDFLPYQALTNLFESLMPIYKATILFKDQYNIEEGIFAYEFERHLSSRYDQASITKIEKIGISEQEALSQIRDLANQPSLKPLTVEDVKGEIMTILNQINDKPHLS